jgi:hypothetical protein
MNKSFLLLFFKKEVLSSFYFMAAAALAALLFECAKGWFADPAHGLFDPDSYMRIVRIRDGLRGGWFTDVVSADNGGQGTVVYWSHLLDGVILALRWPLLAVMEPRHALLAAGAATGPLFAALLAAALVWVPAPLIAHRPRWRWLWAAPVAALLSPALVTYGMLGYVHYHLPLVLLALLAAGCAGRAAAGGTGAGIGCGLLAAADVWLSPESLPYVLMAIGAIGVAWCLRPGVVSRPLIACGLAFCLGTLCAIALDPPFGGLMSPEPDRISVVYGVLAGLVCGLSLLSGPIARVAGSAWMRFALYGVACAGAVGLWLALFPAILRGLAGLIPAADVAAYFGAIDEMHGVPLSLSGFGMLAPCLLAVGFALSLAWRQRSLLWCYAAACGLVVAGLAMAHIRFLGYAEAVAAAMVPLALQHVSDGLARPAAGRIGRRVVMAVFLLPPILPFGSVAARPAEAAPGAPCRVRDIAPALSALGHAVVLTEISDTPEILWRTPVFTVGSLYHRSIGAFMRARAAWRSGQSESVPEPVVATGASYVLACDSMGRTRLIEDLPASTLQDRLNRHEVPGWLHQVAQAGGYRLYRIGG